MRRLGHMGDERLFDAYLAKLAGDQIDPGVAAHLTGCAACSRRHQELTDFMDGLRLDADAEIDAVFPAERLRRQQTDIARRMEHLGETARVISFPGYAAALPPSRHSLPATPRWIAVAAAAGLLVGAAVGTLYHPSWWLVAPRASVSRSAPASAPAAPAVMASQRAVPALDDDAFLSELELAVDGPGCRELRTFDALTPAITDARLVRIGY